MTTESQPQKRPRTKSDSECNEEESPEDDKQKEEEKPSRSNNLKLYSIFTHKPILSFSSKPTTFKSEPVPNEVKKNPPKKYPAKAKKNQTKTVGKETTTSNRITNYFLGSAAGWSRRNTFRKNQAPSRKQRSTSVIWLKGLLTVDTVSINKGLILCIFQSY